MLTMTVVDTTTIGGGAGQGQLRQSFRGHRVALTKPQAGRGPGYCGGLVDWDHCVEGSLVEKCQEFMAERFQACCLFRRPSDRPVQRQ